MGVLNHLHPLGAHPPSACIFRQKKRLVCEGSQRKKKNELVLPLFLPTPGKKTIAVYSVYQAAIYIYIYLEPKLPLVWVGKDLLLEAKQGSFGFQVYK